MIVFSLETIASKTGAVLRLSAENSENKASGVASLDKATAAQVSFLSDHKMKNRLFETKACAVILKEPIEEKTHFHQLIHPDPYLCMIEIAKLFHPVEHPFTGQNFSSSHIDKTALIHPSAHIGPFVFIAEGVQIGAESVIYPYTYLGSHTQVGRDCVIYSNVSIYPKTCIGDRVIIHSGAVLGSDGFGFISTKEMLLKIPQVGRVVIEDDVEIGAGSTIDRATFDQTLIQKGCKIDSQVHIGHNVEVGEQTMLCGQVGIAGSARIGKRCIAAGRAGISQGVRIADRVVLGAASVALQDIEAAGEYQGHPAFSAMSWKRELAARKQLPEIIKRLRRLEVKGS